MEPMDIEPKETDQDETQLTTPPVDAAATTPTGTPVLENPEAVNAEVVNAQGQIGTVTAQTVNVRDGAVANVRGENVHVTVTNGGVGAVMGTTVQAEVGNGGVGAVMAQEATIKGSQVGFVAALRISGDARIAFDMRAGLIAGVAIGLVLAAFRALLGRRH
jgi:hypothetical protein